MEKTEKILAAAYKLFNQHGLRKVTMSDIAEAAEMSRPTLYAAFPSKEAVFEAIAKRHNDRSEVTSAERLPKAKSLRAQLTTLFEIWIVEPYASVIDSPAGLDMMSDASEFAPVAIESTYRRFEQLLFAVLEPALAGKRAAMTAKDLAHIMVTATRGLKTRTQTLVELRRLTAGLITMAVATAS